MSALGPLLMLAQALATPPSVPEETVVVTASALGDSGRALAQCLARRCPPAEDIRATIAYAENQLIAGDLAGARTTLSRSRGRNKRHAAAEPVAVSGLLRFDAEVAGLLGQPDYSRTGTIDSLSALKAGLPADDRRVAAQRLLVADVFLRQGILQTAIRMYDETAQRAAEAGWADIRAAAMFRALTYYATAASIDPAYADQARRRYAALLAETDPAFRAARDASLLLEARLALLKDGTASLDTVMSGLRGMRTRVPMLVATPPVDLTTVRPGSSLLPGGASGTRSVDLEFRVTGDGQVADLQETGRAAGTPDEWIDLVRRSVGGRRYLPLDLPAGSDGVWRRERLMMVADRVADKTTRIRRSVGKPRLYVVDLSAPAGAAAARTPTDGS